MKKTVRCCVMENMKIRPAERADLEEILKIYAYAREFMVRSGNPTQWVNGYPERTMLEEDIHKGNLYAVLRSGKICGVFCFVLGEDPTYAVIEGGTWRSREPYGTIHRIASDGTGGVFPAALKFCREVIRHIRIDTHENNYPMQHLVTKHGFSKRGIIYVADGTPRFAYDLL